MEYVGEETMVENDGNDGWVKIWLEKREIVI